MATYWENSCSFGLRFVSWYMYLIVSLVFSHLGFWSGNLFLLAPFPDLCLLVPSSVRLCCVFVAFSTFFRQICTDTKRTYGQKSKVGNGQEIAQSQKKNPSPKTDVGKTFAKFYRRHYELISKFNVRLKMHLREGLWEPKFYGDLVYKFKKLTGRNNVSFQFRKIILRYKRIGYNINVMRQSVCIVFNPIIVDDYAAFIICMLVAWASDSKMAPTLSYSF